MAPIHRLPVELLAKIVLMALPPAEWEPTFVQWRYLQSNGLKGTYLAHLYILRRVSTRWNEVIEQTPTLWAVFDTIYPKSVLEVALTKSKHAKLTVNMMAPSDPELEEWKGTKQRPAISSPFDVIQAIPRVMFWCRTLYFAFDEATSGQWDAMKDYIQAPELQSLTLEYRDNEWEQQRIIDPFKHDTPKLRELTIRELVFNWESDI